MTSSSSINLIDNNNLKLLSLNGTSMWPRLKTGDLLLWKESSRLSEGDIAILQSKHIDHLVVHRFIAPAITKGDREKWSDQKVHPDIKIVGKALWRVLPHSSKRSYSLVSIKNNALTLWIQTKLNKYNDYQYPIIHRVSAKALSFFNLLVRALDSVPIFARNYSFFFQEPYSND